MTDLYRQRGGYGIYINRTDVTNYVNSIRFRIAKGDIPTLEVNLDHFYEMDTVAAPGNIVAITYDNICLGTGILEQPETKNRGSGDITVRLIGTGGTDLDRSTIAAYDYIDQDQDVIIKKLLTSDNSGTGNWICEAGTVDKRGTATVRVQNQGRLEAVLKICKDNKLWSEFTHPKPTVSTVDSYPTGEDNASGYLDNTHDGYGQSFTCTTETTLDSCKFYLLKTNNPTGYAYAKLYEHSGVYGTSSKPTGTPLATSEALDVEDITTSAALYTFNFAGGQRRILNASSYYVIVVEYTDGTAGDYVRVRMDGSTPSHSGNSCILSSAGTWSSSSADLVFYVYGSDDYHEVDRFDAWDWDDATKYPAKHSSIKTFTKGNTISVARKYDYQRAVNYLRLLGAGDGRNQLEAICYHATDNRSKLNYAMDTWLTTAIAATDGTNHTVGFTIYATSTAGFPASGTIEIDQERFTYTSKDPDGLRFLGCTKAVGYVAASHTTDAQVINITPTYVYVDDNTNFPDTGGTDYIWVGLEKIGYTSKTDTDKLSGTITRGVAWNGTYTPAVKKYYAHGKGCFVMDAQYPATEAGAEAGSSIKVYGLLASTQIDSTIIDQNALDVAAGNLIDVYNIPPEIITLETEPSTLDTVWLGDTITTTDDDTGVDDDYRIYALELTDGSGIYGKLTITAGNSQYDFTKDYSQTKKELGNLSVYAQGVPQTITINAFDDCQGNVIAWTPNAGTPAGSEDDAGPAGLFVLKPLKLEFYIPDEAISINKVILDYNVTKYWDFYYSNTGYATHSHDINEDTSIIYSPVQNLYTESLGTLTDLSTSTWTDVLTLNNTVQGEEACADIYFTNTTGSTVVGFGMRLVCVMSDDSVVVVYPDGTAGYAVATTTLLDDEVYLFSARGLTPISGVGDPTPVSLKVQVKSMFGSTIDTSWAGNIRTYQGSHVHNLDVSLTDEGNHRHGLDYTKTGVSPSFTDMKIAINDGNGYVEKTSTLEDAQHLNRALSTIGETSLDVTEFFGDRPGKKGLKILGASGDVLPLAYGRINAVLRVKYFETNRT